MSRRIQKPRRSKALRLDWDESRRDQLNMAAARCDLSYAAFARIALELLVSGTAVTLSAVRREADRQLSSHQK